MTRNTLPPGGKRLPDGRIKITLDAPRGPDGKRRQRSVIVEKASEAKSAHAALKASIDAGTYIAPAVLTVNGHFDGWMAGKERAVKPSTLLGYELALKPPRALIGTRKLQSIVKADIEAVINDILSRGRTPRTANLTLTVLKAAFQSAVDEGLIPRNPAALVARTREVRFEAQTWSEKERTKFLASITEHEYRIGFELSCLGMRRGEVVGLRWFDVDLTAGTISIRTTTVSVNGKSMASTPKSARSRRVLPIGPDVLEVLKDAHRAAGLQVRSPGATVVARTDGSPLRPEFYGDQLTEAMSDAGVPVIRVHDVRHTFCTLALEAGQPVHAVAAFVGDDPAVVLRTYAHAVPSTLANVAATVRRVTA